MRGLACLGSANVRERRTLKTNTVAPQTLHSLLEENLALGGHSGDVVLLPLNGSVDMLKDLLDGVGNFVTNAVSGNEGDLRLSSDNMCIAARWHETHSVDTTILGWQLDTCK